MDRKTIIILVVCFILLMLWYPLVVNKLYPPKPLPPRATNAPPALMATTNEPAPSPTAPAALEEPAAALKPMVTANAPEELVEVANDNARYTFTSHGGGLKRVELIHYPETVR
jgi:YidC/Oxa1 family membrane protein insertase